MRFDRSSFAAPRAALALLVAAGALVAGCGTSSTTVQQVSKPLSRVTLAVHADTLAVGAQRQFVATAYGLDSLATSAVTLAWRSTDPAVCTIAGTGLATAVCEGATLVIASASGKSDTARVYVRSALAGWNEQHSGTTYTLNAVHFLPDGRTGVAVGVQGTIVMTTDAGATWNLRTSGTSAELTSVWFSDASTGWAVGKAGVLVRSTDGGLSWAQQRALLGTTLNLECVRFVDARHGWIVGGTTGGFVARTRDGGATWTPTSFGGAVFHGVAFADTLSGWAVGEGAGAGVINGTHDGGATWYGVQISLPGPVMHGVARVGSAQAWAVGALGTLATATATAESLAWSPSSAGANYTFNAIHMVSATTGWIAGSNLDTGAILATTNGWTTWTSQASAGTALKGVYFADGLRGWAVGVGGRIVHTSTAGAP